MAVIFFLIISQKWRNVNKTNSNLSMRIIRTKADEKQPSAFKNCVAEDKDKRFSETKELIAVTQQSNVRNLGKHVVTPKTSFLCKKYKNSRKQVKNGSFSADFWSKWRDSNSRPPVPETGALPTALHLVLMIFMRFSVSGQTCGQTEN